MPGTTARTLLRLGAAGQVAFALTFLTEDATRPGFHPWRRWVSHLSLGPWGWVNTVGLAVAGVSALAGAYGVVRLTNRWRGWLPVAGIGGYGAGLVLAAVCPIDPGLGWPPGQPPEHTLSGQLHDLAGMLTFAGLTVAAWAGRRRFTRARPYRPSWVRWSTLAGITVPASFALCSVLVSLDYAGTWPGAPSGLFERIALLTGMAWLISVMIHLSRQVRPSAQPQHPLGSEQVEGSAAATPSVADPV